jgi:hypothetical protein
MREKQPPRFKPMIGTVRESAVYNFVCTDSPKLAAKVDARPCWAVWDETIADFYEGPGASKGFQTRRGCQARCDKLNAGK